MDTILINQIIDIAENNYHFLKNLQNVLGVGLGLKTINGNITDEPCIHVLVEKKLDKSLIVNSQNIIPETYIGIKTDVLEIGKPRFRAFTEKVRPLQSGYSISASLSVSSGTLGAIVTKIIDGERKFYILSNNHVLTDINDFPLGTPILQPGKTDSGTLDNDAIAYLSEFIPLDISWDRPYPINYLDAAIAEIKDESLISTIVASCGDITGIDDAVPNAFVKKSGRTTGLTEGTITTTNTTLDLEGATFKKQIVANLRNLNGDSGSLFLNESNKALGLLFSGSGNNIAFATPIKVVLETLKVKLVINCE